MSVATAFDPLGLRSRLLSAAAGASPVAVFGVDASGLVAFAEGGAVAALSGGKTEIQGRSAAEAWNSTPALVEAVGQALEGVRFSGNLVASSRKFLVRLIPVRHGDGAVVGVAGLAVAVPATPMVRPESGSAELLGALMETLPLSTWVLDHRGDVVHDNGFARAHGMVAVRNAKENAPPGGSLVGRVLLDGLETEGTAFVRDPSGTRISLGVRGIPLRNPKGRAIGAVILADPPKPPAAPPSLSDFDLDLLEVSPPAGPVLAPEAPELVPWT